jgi:hypothetical protein
MRRTRLRILLVATTLNALTLQGLLQLIDDGSEVSGV